MTADPAPAASARRDRRTAFWHRPAVALLAALIYGLGALPPRLVYLLCDLFAVPWYLYWRLLARDLRRSKGYWRNTAIAFRPGAPLGARRPPRHLWRWSRHIAHLVGDFCLLRHLDAANVARHVDFPDRDRMLALFAAGNGLICASGHVGPWDVAGVAMGLHGLPLVAVFRPSPIPALDDLIARLRTRTGQHVVARKNVLWTLKKTLAEHGAIALLCDGGGKHSAVTAPFLGTLARTVATPAVLHLLTGAPIVVATMRRTGCMRYAVRVHDVICERATGDRDADLRRIMARVNAGLGAGIAEAPEQWFWQGRRFRHRPAGERALPGGLPPLADSRPPGADAIVPGP
jgi:KDO2-lipid IV(A) lauroyltransferase